MKYLRLKVIHGFFTIVAVMFQAMIAFGQVTESCGTTDLFNNMIKTDARLKKSFDSIQSLIARKSREMESQRMMFPGAPYRIQTVVQVLGTNAATSPSDSEIRDMIALINRNLRGEDPDLANLPKAFMDKQAGNTFIELCLTDIDQNGQPSDGIVRTVTSTNDYYIKYGDGLKKSMSATDVSTGGITIWNRDRYLNILITPTLYSTDTSKLDERVGVSSYPGFPAEKDCYIVHRYAMMQDGAHTHELGHWLNLIHIWGDTTDCAGTDLVDDTPTQSGPSDVNGINCRTFPQISCENGPDGNMFMNYMDYSLCYSMFTKGQAKRMVDALVASRSGIFNTNCVENITISGTVPRFSRAANTITSSGSTNVPNGSRSNIQAGGRVVLNPGFTSATGSFTRIYIKPCCTNN